MIIGHRTEKTSNSCRYPYPLASVRQEELRPVDLQFHPKTGAFLNDPLSFSAKAFEFIRFSFFSI